MVVLSSAWSPDYKIPSRERKRRARQREEYLQNQDDELESSRIRYDADAEQRRTSARAMYRANLELLRGGDRKRILLQCKFLL